MKTARRVKVLNINLLKTLKVEFGQVNNLAISKDIKGNLSMQVNLTLKREGQLEHMLYIRHTFGVEQNRHHGNITIQDEKGTVLLDTRIGSCDSILLLNGLVHETLELYKERYKYDTPSKEGVLRSSTITNLDNLLESGYTVRFYITNGLGSFNLYIHSDRLESLALSSNGRNVGLEFKGNIDVTDAKPVFTLEGVAQPLDGVEQLVGYIKELGGN